MILAYFALLVWSHVFLVSKLSDWRVYQLIDLKYRLCNAVKTDEVIYDQSDPLTCLHESRPVTVILFKLHTNDCRQSLRSFLRAVSAYYTLLFQSPLPF